MRVLFLNGPPGCGKDTIGRLIARGLPGAVTCKLAAPLKVAAHALYAALRGYAHGGMQAGDFVELEAHDAFEDRKDRQLEEFLGVSPRAAYIELSERMLKPLHGTRFFGELLARRMVAPSSAGFTFVVTDSGFEAEAAPIVEQFGPRNCALVHVMRDGHDFSGDSRSYLSIPGVKTFGVYNRGTLDDLHAITRNLLHRICAEQGWSEGRSL